MTLFDLMKLLKHYWRLVLGLPAACAAAAAVISIFLLSPSYVATATLTSNDPSGTVSADTLIATVAPIAQSYAAEFSGDGVEVVVAGPKSGATSAELRVLTFTATGREAEKAIDAVNESAALTSNDAAKLFAALGDDYKERQDRKSEIVLETLDGADPNVRAMLETVLSDRDYSHCSFEVAEADSATEEGKSPLKLTLVAAFVGLFIAGCAVVVIDVVRTPIKSRYEVEDKCKIPVLSWPSGGNEGERLWANVCFRLEREPSSLALVPVNGNLDRIVDRLALAVEKTDVCVSVVDSLRTKHPTDDEHCVKSIEIVKCDSLLNDVAAAYSAHRADATVVCICEWKDSIGELLDTLKELELAEARVLGVAMLAKE